MADELSWMRRNLPLVVALFSLLMTSAGGYASYRLLEQKVASLEVEMHDRAERNATAIKETRSALDDHLVATSNHMDPQKWQLLLDRLTAIEQKLDRLR